MTSAPGDAKTSKQMDFISPFCFYPIVIAHKRLGAGERDYVRDSSLRRWLHLIGQHVPVTGNMLTGVFICSDLGFTL